MKKIKNRGGYLLPLIFITVILFSCGIPTYIYIYPPVRNGPDISFIHDSRNNKDPNFINLGYDIYYRIYDNSENSQFDGLSVSGVESILVSNGNTYFNSGNINKLIFRTFSSDSLYKPIKQFSNDKGFDYTAPPVLPIDNSESVDESFFVNISLEQGNSNNPYLETVAPYSSTLLPEKIWFRRYLSDDKDFTDFDNSDEDISFQITSDRNVLISFFVISYGFTVEYYTLISEKPIYIGFTTLTF